ncbi:hypothetical protein CEXT_52351 [Caerostris extrusa]|uniref:Uncharacterized protein n=1 Tax=Caerostris extrusa TaxID=172846 RepID=A0AAV4RRH4_CAEEX|nr:hypothetical protein CEXT_52351 [Caerostris extrusa]
MISRSHHHVKDLLTTKVQKKHLIFSAVQQTSFTTPVITTGSIAQQNILGSSLSQRKSSYERVGVVGGRDSPKDSVPHHWPNWKGQSSLSGFAPGRPDFCAGMPYRPACQYSCPLNAREFGGIMAIIFQAPFPLCLPCVRTASIGCMLTNEMLPG